jgi:hypothetical protein
MNEITGQELVGILAQSLRDLQAGKATPAHASAAASTGNAICKLAAVRVATARLAGVKPSGEMMRFAGL